MSLMKIATVENAIQAVDRFRTLAEELVKVQQEIVTNGLTYHPKKKIEELSRAVRRSSLDVTQAVKNMRTDR